jgi:putative Holliday junction resolvase
LTDWLIDMARTLALDIGEKRIGVAVGDETGTLAHPLTAITRASKRQDFERIARLVIEQRAERVVAGYPRSLSGDEGPQAQRVRRYVEALAAALPVLVELWDERYTTVEATERLHEAERRRPRDRGQLDASAAAIILQDYLDTHRSPLADKVRTTDNGTRDTEHE